MTIKLLITVEVERSGGGKFRSKDEIADALIEELSDPGSVTVEETEYDVTNFEIERADD